MLLLFVFLSICASFVASSYFALYRALMGGPGLQSSIFGLTFSVSMAFASVADEPNVKGFIAVTTTVACLIIVANALVARYVLMHRVESGQTIVIPMPVPVPMPVEVPVRVNRGLRIFKNL